MYYFTICCAYQIMEMISEICVLQSCDEHALVAITIRKNGQSKWIGKSVKSLDAHDYCGFFFWLRQNKKVYTNLKYRTTRSNFAFAIFFIIIIEWKWGLALNRQIHTAEWIQGRNTRTIAMIRRSDVNKKKRNNTKYQNIVSVVVSFIHFLFWKYVSLFPFILRSFSVNFFLFFLPILFLVFSVQRHERVWKKKNTQQWRKQNSFVWKCDWADIHICTTK